jgi:hypothetical protein
MKDGMEKRLVLEDSEGRVVRAYAWQGQTAQVIRRSDTRRLEVLLNTEDLESKKIAFEKLGQISSSELSNKPFLIGKLGHLKLVEDIQVLSTDLPSEKENEKRWHRILATVFILAMLFIGLLQLRPNTYSEAMEESLKQQVVKIVKRTPPKPKVDPTLQMNSQPQETTVTKTKTTQSLKRMGALAALGSLSKSKQHSGLNLNAANTTAGPGLGGTQGSGGVQTSLYAKGVVAAPLGAGGNIQGSGGYGTKGKGGGQAGYGQMSLIGAAGNNAIPLTQEATVAAGLDRDMIAAVINRNSGQIRFCYEQGLQGNPSLNGRVAVDFTIGGNGLVKIAGIESSSINSKIIEDCILLRLKTWKFPLPQGGVDVKVSYPFVLRRAGQS